MAVFFWSSRTVPLLGLLLLLLTTTTSATFFRQAPIYQNSDSSCTFSPTIHIAMTLDSNYLRGTIAAVNSILRHSSCPATIAFHFLSLPDSNHLLSSINSTFPNLNFKTYHFNSSKITTLISKSVRQALDQPLNYARIYLAEILPNEVKRLIYLDSDLVVIDDISKLYGVDLREKVLAAPEYCHANLTRYFTEAFWSDPTLYRTFEGRKPCYFNTGVMVMDLEKWRNGDYTKRVEDWMIVQKQRRIYQLGSMPPFLLVLAGNIEPVDHRWNQHGLGGDNVHGRCRGVHPGPVSLLHWSGHGKPWSRRDAGKQCIVDLLWNPYDLYAYQEAVSFQGHSFAE